MNTPDVANSTNSKGFLTKVMEMDSETKNGLMNGIQYMTMAVMPIAIIDQLTKSWFSSTNPSDKGSVELLAEVLGQAVLTLILLFMVHKLIIAVPTYTGTPMTRINYSTISLGFLATIFATHPEIGDKLSVIFNRLQDYWEGTPENSHKKRKHDNSKVSVSQPISGGRQSIPTHQASRADYATNHAKMLPVQTGQPPIVPRQQQQMPQQQQPQSEPSSGQQMYGGSQNPLVGASMPAQEPMAANSVMGGGWSAW